MLNIVYTPYFVFLLIQLRRLCSWN